MSDRIEVTAGIIRREDRFLVCCRPQGKHRAGFWEFPGGKLEAGETFPECLRRELREELGIETKVTREIAILEEAHIRLHFFLAETTDTPNPTEHSHILWAQPKELQTLPFCPGDSAMLAATNWLRILPEKQPIHLAIPEDNS